MSTLWYYALLQGGGSGASAAAGTISSTTSVPTPSIVAGGSATVNATTISQVASLAGQSVSAGSASTVSATTISRTASLVGQAATAGTGATISQGTISRTAGVPIPTVSQGSGPINIAASTISRTASLAGPVVSGGATPATFGSVQATNIVATASPTLTLPTGVASGDLLLAWLVADNVGNTLSTPATGWFAVPGVVQGMVDALGNDHQAWLYYKIAGTSETNPTFTFGGAITGAGAVIRYTNINTGTPFNTTNSGQQAVGTTHNIPQITTTDACMIVSLISCDESATYTPYYTPPSGWTERLDYESPNSLIELGIAELLQSAAGTVAGAWTAVDGDGDAMYTLAINGAGSGLPAGTTAPGTISRTVAITRPTVSDGNAQTFYTLVVGADPQLRLNNESYRTRNVVTSDKAVELNPDMILIAGDCAENGTTAEYTDPVYGWAQHWGRAGLWDKVYAVPGNHDWLVTNAADYAAFFGTTRGGTGPTFYRSWDTPNGWHIVGLNSNISMVSGSAQYNWLMSDLAANSNKPTILYYHHPRWSNGNYADNPDSADMWAAIIGTHPQVELWLTGHDHCYQRYTRVDANGIADSVNGIAQITIGMCGSTRVAPTTRDILAARNTATSQHGIIRLRLYSDRYEWQFFETQGSTPTLTDSGSQTIRVPAGGTPATAAPATISRVASIAGHSVGAGSAFNATPATISRVASIAAPTISQTASTTATPATISRTVQPSYPTVTAARSATASPTTVSRTARLVRPDVGLSAGQSDNFDRADGSLGANWTISNGGVGYITSNRAQVGYGTAARFKGKPNGDSSNFFAQAAFHEGIEAGIAIFTSDWDSSSYLSSIPAYFVSTTFSEGQVGIWQLDADGIANQVASSTYAIQHGEILRIEFDGTTVRAYANGLLRCSYVHQYYNVTWPAGVVFNRGGLITPESAPIAIIVDDFSVGPIPSTVAAPVTISPTVVKVGNYPIGFGFSASSGSNTTIAASTISRTVGMTGHVAAVGSNALVLPGTISRTVGVPTPTLSTGGVTITPTTISRTASLAGTTVATQSAATATPSTLSRAVSIAGHSFSAGIGFGPTPTTINRAVVIGDTKTIASESLPLRGIFYYPWFTGGNPQYPGAWTQGTNPWTQFHPKRGYYDSANPTIVAEHIDDMVYGKFKVGIASWWGEGSREDTCINTLLEQARIDGRGFKWCLYYEMEGNAVGQTPGSPNPSAAQIASDLNYISANYTNHPNYLHVNGKPVVFVYGDGSDNDTVTLDITQRPAARWKAAMALTTEQWYINMKVYTGYTNDQVSYPLDSWHQYAPAVAVDTQGTYARTISPRFIRGDNDSGWGYLAPISRATWQQNVRDLLAGNFQWKLVTSYNEWGEGHSIEVADRPSSWDPGTNPNRVYDGLGWDSASGFGWLMDDMARDGVNNNFNVDGLQTIARRVTIPTPNVNQGTINRLDPALRNQATGGSAASGTTDVITIPATAAGSTLVLIIAQAAATTGIAISSIVANGDGATFSFQNGTSTTAGPPPLDYVGGTNSWISLAYASNVPAGITQITITYAATKKLTGIHVSEWTNVESVTPVDGSVRGGGSTATTNHVSSTLTSSISDSLILFAINAPTSGSTLPTINTGTSTPSTGWTALLGVALDPAVAMRVGYRNTDTASNFALGWTIGTSAAAGMIGMGLKGAPQSGTVINASTVSRTASFGAPTVQVTTTAAANPTTLSRAASISGHTARAGAYVLAAAITGAAAIGVPGLLSGTGVVPTPTTTASTATVATPNITAGTSTGPSVGTISRTASLAGHQIGFGRTFSATTISRTASIPAPVGLVTYRVTPAGISRTVSFGQHLLFTGVIDWAWDPQASIYEMDPVVVENPLADISGGEFTSASIYDNLSTSTTFDAFADITGNTPGANIEDETIEGADILQKETFADIVPI